MTHEKPQEAISLKMSVEKTALSPGERFNVFFTVETSIPHNFRRFQHLPKAFKLALVEEFPRKYKKGDKTVQKVSFIAPRGQVPSEFQLIFEFMFEKEDTSLMKITTVPLLIRILQPEEIPSDQLSIIAEHTVDINGKVSTTLQEFPKLEVEKALLAEEMDTVEAEMETVDTERITELPPETTLSETTIEEQMEESKQIMEPEDIPTEISLSEDNTDMLTEKISEYTKRIVSLEDQLQKQTRELNIREEEIVDLKSECTRLDDALGKYREHVNDLERTFEEITPKLNELEIECSERGKKIHQLEEINTNLQTQLDEKDKEIERQKDELEKLLNYKTQTEQQMAALTSKIKELELLTSDQSAQIIALEQARKELNNQLDLKAEEILQLRKELNNQLDKKTEEIMQLQKERDELQVTQRQVKRQVTQLEKQIQEFQTNTEQLQGAIGERDAKINHLKRLLNDAGSQLTEKDTVLAQQQREIEALKAQLKIGVPEVEGEEQIIEEPSSEVIEYFGPPEEEHVEELREQEETLLPSIEPVAEERIDETGPAPVSETKIPLQSSEGSGLIEEITIEEPEEIAIEETEEKKRPMPTVPKCAICGGSGCPVCGSSTLFCKVRCTHCKSIFHQHCAKSLLPSEKDYFIRCPTCNEKIVL